MAEENGQKEKSQERMFLDLGKDIITNQVNRIVATVKEGAGRIFDPNALTDVLLKRRYRNLRAAGLSHDRALSIMKEEMANKFPKEEGQ